MKKGACREKERKPASPKFQRLAEGEPSGAPRRYQAFISNQRFRSRGIEMGNRSWTDDEDLQLREMWATGITLDKIGRRLNRTKNAVSTRAKRIGLEKTEGTRQCRPWTLEEEERLRLMWGEGASLRDIAQAICRTYPAVCCYTNKLGLPPRAPKHTGGSRFKKAVAAHGGLRVANSGISTRLPSKKAMKAARKYAAKLFAPVDHSPEAMEARRAVSRMNHAKAQRNWVQDMFRGCEIPKSTLKRLGLPSI